MSAFGTLAKYLGNPADMVPARLPTSANPDLLLNRIWFGKSTPDGIIKDPEVHAAWLGKVAAAVEKTDATFLSCLHDRRAAAVAGLADRSAQSAQVVTITPSWRVVVGRGTKSISEAAITFSSVYGLPVWPGSALKGLAASFARIERAGTDPADQVRIFGTGGDGQAHVGAVVVHDAFPIKPPTLAVDVLTPHVKPYYDDVNSTNGVTANTPPPAEYHAPVPVRFLAVESTAFRTLVRGPADDVMTFLGWLRGGLDDLGIGGKTSSGYGYCTVEIEDLQSERP